MPQATQAFSTAYVEQTFTPGRMQELQCASAAAAAVTDANGIALDSTTAAASATMTARDGTTPLAATVVPYDGSNRWHLLVPGNDYALGAVLQLTATLTDVSLAVTRLPGCFVLRPGTIPQVSYRPGEVYPVRVTLLKYLGTLVPSSQVGTATVTTTVRSKNNSAVGAAADSGSLVYDLTSGAWQYDVPGAVMTAATRLRLVVQFTDLGGNQTWAYWVELISDW